MAGLLEGSVPTLDQMIRWRDILNNEWTQGDDGISASSFIDDVHEEERTYFQQFDVWGVDAKLIVKTGSAPSDADAAIDGLVPVDPTVKVKPLRNRTKHKAQAEKLKMFGMGMLAAWKRQKRDLFPMMAADQVIRRVMVCRVLFDNRLWPTLPSHLDAEYEDNPDLTPEENADAKQEWDDTKDDWLLLNRRKVPIVLERRDPRYTRWREADDGSLLVASEDYYASALEAFAQFQHLPLAAEHLGSKEPDDLVRVSDIFVGKYRCILLDDRAIYPNGGVLKHLYEKVPYLIAPFRKLPFDNPAQRYRGMLSNSQSLYRGESQVLSMNLHMLGWNAWRTFKGWTVDDRPLDIIPGKYLSIDTRRGEYLDLLQGDPVPPELLQMADVFDHYIQRNGVAQGPRTAEGTRSAAQVWAIQAQRQAKIDNAKQAFQGLMCDAISMAAAIVEKIIDGPMTFPVPGRNPKGEEYGEQTIKPSDINGYWDGFEVDFGRRLDPALLEQAKTLMTFAMNNWMPLQISWQMSGLTDSPEEWKEMLITETTEKLPFIMEVIALKRLKEELGEGDPEYQALYQNILMSHQGAAGAGEGTPPGAPGQPPGGGGGLTPSSANPGPATSPGGSAPSGIAGAQQTTPHPPGPGRLTSQGGPAYPGSGGRSSAVQPPGQ